MSLYTMSVDKRELSSYTAHNDVYVKIPMHWKKTVSSKAFYKFFLLEEF